jgi:hypothetical protein
LSDTTSRWGGKTSFSVSFSNAYLSQLPSDISR